jgi:hypothetical protein
MPKIRGRYGNQEDLRLSGGDEPSMSRLIYFQAGKFVDAATTDSLIVMAGLLEIKSGHDG